jgi:hypothetical protein
MKSFLLLFCLFYSFLSFSQINNNIILIGWDGAQRDHLNQCLEQKQLPVLKRLITEGSYVEIEIYGTTDTKAGWSQILTGYDPAITGIYSNSSFSSIPAGYSIFERLKDFFGPTFFTAAIICKKGHMDTVAARNEIIDRALYEQIDSIKRLKPSDRSDEQKKRIKAFNKKYRNAGITIKNDTVYAGFPGDPYHYSRKGCDEFYNGLIRNRKAVRYVTKMLRKHKNQPFFFFVHFAEIDVCGHLFGENSRQYNSAIKSCDRCTGKIIRVLKRNGLYDHTFVYVTADHGFDEGKKNHTNAPHVFLISNDKHLKKNGTRADITPTILDRFGIDIRKISPPLSGHSLCE